MNTQLSKRLLSYVLVIALAFAMCLNYTTMLASAQEVNNYGISFLDNSMSFESPEGKTLFVGTGQIEFILTDSSMQEYPNATWKAFRNGVKLTGDKSETGFAIDNRGPYNSPFTVLCFEPTSTQSGKYTITATYDGSEFSTSFYVAKAESAEYVLSKNNNNAFVPEIKKEDTNHGQKVSGNPEWFKYDKLFPTPANGNFDGDKINISFKNASGDTDYASFVCKSHPENGYWFEDSTKKIYGEFDFADLKSDSLQSIYFDTSSQESVHWDLGEHEIDVIAPFFNNQSIGKAKFKIVNEVSKGNEAAGDTLSKQEISDIYQESVKVVVGEDGVIDYQIDKDLVEKLLQKASENKDTVSLDIITDDEDDTTKTDITLPEILISGMEDKNVNLEINTPLGSVTFDAQAMKAMKGQDVNLVLESINKSDKNIAQYDISLKKNNSEEKISKFGKGNVKLSLPAPENLGSEDDINAVYLQGKYAFDMNAKSDGKGNAVFNTNHFSTYAVMSSKDAQKKIISSIKISKAGAIKAKASKKGVKLTWKSCTGNTPEQYNIYRSTKKNSGFKKIKTLSNSKRSYIDKSKSLKKGKTYYYKVKGYTKIDKKSVFTKASSTLKIKAK